MSGPKSNRQESYARLADSEHQISKGLYQKEWQTLLEKLFKQMTFQHTALGIPLDIMQI